MISAFSLAISLTGCPESPSAPDRSIRKIILISLDTLRADHLGVYDYSRDTSPRIDEFARRAFVFERALASAPNTPPSQMSMMTSRYPGQHGFTGDGDTMAPSLETLAERLRKAGLKTAGFVDGGYLSSEFGFDRGFEIYDDEGGGLEEILPRALAWLDANGDDPFFLFLHSYDIHAPYLSPPPYDGMFHDEPYAGDLIPTAERMDEIFFAQQTVEPEDMQHLVDSYDEGIRYADAQIGRLLDHLRSSGDDAGGTTGPPAVTN
ncbi:MAG: sulfatase-like hydrolase/transferase, partial [Proteobacteria bacterium]|nr:sulfatase-like hydrolase/transferase [Pseudomonadota bacterium]